MNKAPIYLLFLSTAFLSAQGAAQAANGKKPESVKPALTSPLPLVPTPVPSGVESKPLAKDMPSHPKQAAPSFTHLQLSSDGSVPSSAGVSRNLELFLKSYEDKLNKSDELLRKYDDKLRSLGISVDSIDDKLARSSHDWVYFLLLFVLIFQIGTSIYLVFFPNRERFVQANGMDSSVQAEALGALKQASVSLKTASTSLTQTKTDLSQQIKPLSEVAPKLAKALEDFSEQNGKLDALQSRFDICEAELKASNRDCEAARAEVASSRESNSRLSAQEERLNSDLSVARSDLDTAISERDTSRNSEMELRKDKNELSGKNSQLESELKSERALLVSANTALLEARQAAETNGVQLEASFARFAPKFLADPEIAQFMRKLHGESLAGVGSATAVWSTLTAFASAEADPAAKDFQLHVLKRLGTVLSHYWKEQPGSSPKDRHERLSHWARCLNEHAQGRYNLFVPAIGSPVDRTKMTTAMSATIVQEVLCWQVRNPAGANYSLAEVA